MDERLLSSLRPGGTGPVVRVEGAGDVRRRLVEMGFGGGGDGVLSPPPPVDYGPDIESTIAATQIRLAALLSSKPPPGSPGPGPAPAGAATRWTAISLLEGDPQVRDALAARPGETTILAERDEREQRAQSERDADVSLLLANRRFPLSP